MVSINVTAFLTPVLTDFNFAPTYFKLLPAQNFGSDFLLLAKFLNGEPCRAFYFSSWKFIKKFINS